MDLIDEASSSLKIMLENKPPILEETHRKIMRLEIEKEALKKEVSFLKNGNKDRKKRNQKENQRDRQGNWQFVGKNQRAGTEMEKRKGDREWKSARLKKNLEKLAYGSGNAEMRADLVQSGGNSLRQNSGFEKRFGNETYCV